MALTPMVLTARLIKQKEPDCKIVFVGPCAAKKLEASRKSIRSYVDFVLTFEEVAGMLMRKVWTGRIFRKANLYSVQVQMDAVLQSAEGLHRLSYMR